METDPLQQLRDIHLPPEPSWWPPAVGWWVLAIGLLVFFVWLTRLALRAWQRRAPIRAARKLYASLHQNLINDRINELAYANQCNELAKRLLVRGLGRTDLSSHSTNKWLRDLDEVSQSQDFTKGAGQSLGITRFQPAPTIDTNGLHAAMTKFLAQVTP